jgi:hypothetical protein
MNVYERPRALALAVRPLDPAVCSRIFNAIERNDAAAAAVWADRALDVLVTTREAERRLVAENAARIEQRRAAVAPRAIDEDEVIERAAQALTNAIMARSRPSYLRKVSSNG